MKKTNTKEHAKDTAREIEELKSSEYFQTMTGAEKDRAIANHEREMRARKYTRPLWKNFFRTMPYESFVADTLFDKRDSGEDTAPIHKDDHPLVSGYGAPGLMAINAGFYCEGEDHLLNVLDKMGTWLSCELLDGEPKSAANLTPKHYALLELDNALNELVFCIEKHMYSHRTVGAAIQFGALMMRLGVVFPDTGNADVLKSIEQMREQISAALETHKKSELMQGPADDFIFRQDGGPGGFWTIRYDGTDLPHVPASKGMMQIHRLLSKRMDPVPARELYHIPNHVHPDALKNNSEALADTHGTEWSREYVYDDPGAARKAMQGRLDDIEAELAEQSTPAAGRSPAEVLETRDELRVEQAKLTKAIREISATIRTGGPQLARDDKRTAVKGTIDRAITMIGKTTRCDELARHLANMIETGTTCIYKGDHDWLTE